MYNCGLGKLNLYKLSMLFGASDQSLYCWMQTFLSKVDPKKMLNKLEIGKGLPTLTNRKFLFGLRWIIALGMPDMLTFHGKTDNRPKFWGKGGLQYKEEFPIMDS